MGYGSLHPHSLIKYVTQPLGASTAKADAASLPEQGSIQTAGSEGIDDDAVYPHGHSQYLRPLMGKW